jgi:hypothetical protein
LRGSQGEFQQANGLTGKYAACVLFHNLVVFEAKRRAAKSLYVAITLAF